MNNLEVFHGLIKIGENRSRFRFHHGLLRLQSSKLTDRLHRLQKREHNKFYPAVNCAAEQVCPAMSCDSSKRRKNSSPGVLNIFA